MSEPAIENWGKGPEKEKVSFYIQTSTINLLRNDVTPGKPLSQLADYFLALGHAAYLNGYDLTPERKLVKK